MSWPRGRSRSGSSATRRSSPGASAPAGPSSSSSRIRSIETTRPRARASSASSASGFGPSGTRAPSFSASTGPRRRISTIGPDNRRMQPGATIGGYELAEQLGEGATALVFRASDGQREVALKLLRPEQARDPERRARFLREARVAAEVQGRHLVPVLAAGEDDGRPVLGLPLYSGSLAQRLDAGPLASRRAAALVTDVAAALDALHGRGLVHRDVKPSNVLVDAEDRAQLADFGLATARDWTRLTRDGAL